MTKYVHQRESSARKCPDEGCLLAQTNLNNPSGIPAIPQSPKDEKRLKDVFRNAFTVKQRICICDLSKELVKYQIIISCFWLD